MKKAEDSKRNMFTLGALYEFSDDRNEWEPWVLENINTNETAQYRVQHNTGFLFIRECQAHRGIIEPPKVPLVDNHIYQFEHKETKRVHVGFYRETNEGFYSVNAAGHKGIITFARECINIQRLVIEK